MNTKPEFSKFTYQELLEAERGIDKSRFPERYEEILSLLKKHESSLKSADNAPSKKQPKVKRVRSKKEIIISTVLLSIYTVYSLIQQEIPGIRYGLNPVDNYYLYWLSINSFIGVCIYNIHYYIKRKNA